MQNEASIVIDRPIQQVFNLTNNHVAEWSITVVEDEVIEQSENGVGTTFRSVTENRGDRMEFHGTVTNYDPPRHSAVHLVGQMFDIVAEYSFEDLHGSTRVTQKSHVSGKGMFKLIFLVMSRLMKKSGCKAALKELQSLKKFCESKPVSG